MDTVLDSGTSIEGGQVGITLTEAAADHITRYLARKGRGKGLRLGIKTSGCSGNAYVVEVAESIRPEDTVFEDHGVKIVVDAGSLRYLEGTEVDYRKDGLNGRFSFHNPNTKETCGCGESFSV